MDTRAAHPSTATARTSRLHAALSPAAQILRTVWDLATAPLRRACRDLRPCRREQLGYDCHSYLPRGCEMCGRHDNPQPEPTEPTTTVVVLSPTEAILGCCGAHLTDHHGDGIEQLATEHVRTAHTR